MKLKRFTLLGSVAAFVAAGAILHPVPSWGIEPPDAEETEGFEVLTRGPVHEAFAESVSFEPEPGLIISTAPPELIEELPPEQQPEGDNVMWIPGYWAWDEDESDFLWISGIWRNLPPEREWIPGYWNEIDGGQYQWVSGYWADAEVEEVEYIAAAPPESIDAGPNIAAPSEDHSWVPGNWAWHQSRYAWRPGYWVMPRDDWNWVPSRYCWTPRGYVYVDGYWDYAVARRGILFAPVHFRHHVYSSPGYSYTPSIVVSLSVFSDHLFVRPRFRHYYFGDYYDTRYRDRGFYASHAWHKRRHCYDPIYAHNRWHHRHDRGWDRRRVEHFNYFRDHAEARPSHRWAAMRGDRNERFRDNVHGRTRQFASTLNGFAKKSGDRNRFRTIGKERRTQFAARGREMRKFGQQRRQLESRGTAASGGREKAAVWREKLARSPISGKRGKDQTAGNSPPKRPEARLSKARLNAAKGKGLASGLNRKGNEAPAGTGLNRGTRGSGKAVRPGMTNRQNKDRAVTPGKANRGTGKAAVRGKETPAGNNARAGDSGKRNTQLQNRQQKLREALKRQNQPQRKKAAESPKRQAQPQRKASPTPKRQAQPQRKASPTPKRQAQPQRKASPTPKRQAQPQRKASPTPKRQAQPQRKASPTPKRKAQPQRKASPTPKRQAQPQRKASPTPKRKAQPQRQRQAQPQRQRQAQPQRQRQAKPQRQRQAQPQRQRQAQPQRQRQAQPQRQRQAQPQRQQRQKGKGGRDKNR